MACGMAQLTAIMETAATRPPATVYRAAHHDEDVGRGGMAHPPDPIRPGMGGLRGR